MAALARLARSWRVASRERASESIPREALSPCLCLSLRREMRMQLAMFARPAVEVVGGHGIARREDVEEPAKPSKILIRQRCRAREDGRNELGGGRYAWSLM